MKSQVTITVTFLSNKQERTVDMPIDVSAAGHFVSELFRYGLSVDGGKHIKAGDIKEIRLFRP